MGSRRRPKPCREQLPQRSSEPKKRFLWTVLSRSRAVAAAAMKTLWRVLFFWEWPLWRWPCWEWNGWNWMFRLLSLPALIFLVSERVYETGASISSPSSDPRNPFTFPFSVQNNSHIFTLKNIRWTCNVISMKTGGVSIENVGFSFGSEISEIDPGRVGNVSCRRAIRTNLPISSLSMEIQVSYKTYFFWIPIPLPTRHPSEIFTWVTEASNPQWIRGSIP